MSSVNHKIAGTPPLLGNSTFSVGDGGMFETIDDAVNHIASLSPYTEISYLPYTGLGTVEVAVDTSVVTGTSTAFSHFAGASGLMIEFNGDGNFYPIKSVHGDTKIYLYGGLSSAVAASSTFKVYRLNPYTIKIVGGVLEHTSTADIDLSALDNYDITICGDGRTSSYLEFGFGTLSGTSLILPDNAIVTLDGFSTIRRNGAVGGAPDIAGGTNSLVVLNDFGMQGHSVPGNAISITPAGFIATNVHIGASPKSLNCKIKSTGYVHIDGWYVHSATTDEELQLHLVGDTGYDTPWIINNFNAHRVPANSSIEEGILHLYMTGTVTQSKQVIVTSPVITLGDSAASGNFIHFDAAHISGGTGRMKGWVSAGTLVDISGGAASAIGLKADGNMDVIMSSVYNNAATATSALNGATIT